MWKQCLVLATAAAAAAAAQAKILMSTGNTIVLADFDGAKFTMASQTNVSVSASWLAYAKPDRLFAVNELGSETTVFSIDLASNTIAQKAQAQGSRGLVHLKLSTDARRMVGAAYGNGTVDVFDVSSGGGGGGGGGIKLLKTVPSHDKPGSVVATQPSRPHQAVLDPSGRYFVVNDLGFNHILVLDSADDAFTVLNHVPVEPAGCGPRHGAFFPVGAGTTTAGKATHYIVVCETKNLVNVYSLRYGGPKGIDFTLQQSLSTFDAHHTPLATAAAGELVIAPDNRNVYVSNRLSGTTDTIANFRVVTGGGHASSKCHRRRSGPSGAETKLELVGLTSTSGKSPRMFSIAHDGQTLLIGNTEGEMAVVALKRNQDGTLPEKPVASIAAGAFPGGKGPVFIEQIA
ncbi:hypothetical protein E4U43_003988 [Claviceps pusilla]|uniref:6-phosphogluconolactonase n=1 Tax=Claviceps pusilla TaxID=123648 RepID=A0A9P7N4H7_9HYPO|nr:hypothetical protein E4U43_003988 [Claviceps pusilla]